MTQKPSTELFNFGFRLRFRILNDAKVYAPNAYKIQSFLKEFPEEFMKSPKTNYIAIYATVWFLAATASC